MTTWSDMLKSCEEGEYWHLPLQVEGSYRLREVKKGEQKGKKYVTLEIIVPSDVFSGEQGLKSLSEVTKEYVIAMIGVKRKRWNKTIETSKMKKEAQQDDKM